MNLKSIRFGHTGALIEWFIVTLKVKDDELIIHYPPNKWGATTRKLKRIKR